MLNTFIWSDFLFGSYFRWPLALKQPVPQRFIGQMKLFNIFWVVLWQIHPLWMWKLEKWPLEWDCIQHFRETWAGNNKFFLQKQVWFIMRKTQKRTRGAGQDFWKDPILLAMVWTMCNSLGLHSKSCKHARCYG